MRVWTATIVRAMILRMIVNRLEESITSLPIDAIDYRFSLSF
jgi:hypothetical protein